MRISFVKHGIFALAMVFSTSAALAATQNVTANVRFITPLSFTDVTNINFGTVTAGVAATYTITTAGVASTVGGEYLSGTPVVGSVKINGSAFQTINISVTHGAAVSGVSVTASTCNYNAAGVASPCVVSGGAAPTSTGKTLLIGATVSADGNQVDSNTPISPVITITVVYT